MVYAVLPTVVAGNVIAESWGNQVKANFDASPNALVTTAGDIVYATGAGTFARLPAGATASVLTIAGGVPVWSPASTTANPVGVAGGSLAGSYPNPTIAAGAVGTTQLAAGAVGTTQLGAGAVATGNIQNNAVDQNKIALGSLVAAHFAAGAVDTAALGAAVVTLAKMAAASVDTANLVNGAVSTGKIANNAVDANKIALNTLVAAHFAAGAVDTAALGALSVTTAKIAAGAVDGTKLAASLALPTLGGNVTFAADNAYDIGASGASRPRDLFLSRNLYVGGGAEYVVRAAAALSNGAGASAGTLGNSPVPGNPTKWLKIDDGGTLRYFPCW